MKEQFKPIRIIGRNRQVIAYANLILDEYEKVTARQLYYQFVARGYLDELGFRPDASGSTNNPQSYKRLTGIISDGRLNGDIDWSKLEDRGREPTVWRHYSGPADVLKSGIYSYRLDRWEGQSYYAELWVEKEALASVLEPVADESHVTMMVNKGYSSSSAMYESARRFLYHCRDNDKEPVLFYIGDFDPSGEDMVRDISDRMRMFGVDLDVRKVALTMEQIQKHKPPPNPAKVTDPRAKNYIRQHGRKSWEVDALDPNELQRLIRRGLSSVIDVHALNKVKEREKGHVERLEEIRDDLQEEFGE